MRILKEGCGVWEPIFKEWIANMQAIVLTAGRGKRINSKTTNKVLLPLAGRPMIGYTLSLLKKLGIRSIIMVVGFKKEKVKKFLGDNVFYVEQKKRLGTAHAVLMALGQLEKRNSDILILNGDDSAFYTPEIMQKLIALHKRKKAQITFLTVTQKKPLVGRIVRTNERKILGIIEPKEATEDQLKIKEVNSGCYLVQRAVLDECLPKVKKNPFTGEYHFTDIINLVAKDKGKIESLKIPARFWQGVNTPQEYQKAERMMKATLKL